MDEKLEKIKELSDTYKEFYRHDLVGFIEELKHRLEWKS